MEVFAVVVEGVRIVHVLTAPEGFLVEVTKEFPFLNEAFGP